MTLSRRQLLRTAQATAMSTRQASKLQAQLATERDTLARWTSRLKRAFHAFERQQAKIKRLEQRLQRLGR